LKGNKTTNDFMIGMYGKFDYKKLCRRGSLEANQANILSK